MELWRRLGTRQHRRKEAYAAEYVCRHEGSEIRWITVAETAAITNPWRKMNLCATTKTVRVTDYQQLMMIAVRNLRKVRKIIMTVYEMIQELAQYDADLDVEINVTTDDYETTVEVEEDVKDGEETDVKLDIDEDIEDFDIDDYKKYTGKRIVRINAELR